jgi:hypothetical protein
MRRTLAMLGMLLLAGPAIAPLHAQEYRFTYSAGTHRYRVTTRVHREQIQGGGRAPFEFDVTTTQLVTLHLDRQSPDTLRLTITVDSVAVSSDLAAPPPDVHPLMGTRLVGLISPQGRVYRFDPPSGNADPRIAALYSAFRGFLIPFPTQPVTIGASWVDTTTDRTERDGFTVITRAIISSRIAGDTTVAGHPAWRIERRSEIAQAGDKMEGGYPIHLASEGTVNGTHVVTRDGIYLGSQSTQRLSMTMTMQESEGAPINQTIRSTVERLERP